MSTRTMTQHICDRSGRYIEARSTGRLGFDLLVSAPWIPTLGELVEADDGGARNVAPMDDPLFVGQARAPDAIFDDLGDRDRLVVAKLIARLLKIPEADLVAAAVARDGRPLAEALELNGEPEPEPEP